MNPLFGFWMTLKDLCLHKSTKILEGGRVRTLKKLKGIFSSNSRQDEFPISKFLASSEQLLRMS